MKTIYTMATLAFFGLASAQKTIEIQEFKSLAISGDVTITLVQSNENKLVIDGVSQDDEDEEISVSQRSGALAIGGDGKATLYYKKSFESLAVASDAVVIGKDEIKVRALAIAVAEDATVDLTVNVTRLNTAAASDAIVNLKGEAEEHNVSLDSDSVLNAVELKTKSTTVTATNDAIANITATDTVNATADSDAVIDINGNPKTVNETATNDGVIKRS